MATPSAPPPPTKPAPSGPVPVKHNAVAVQAQLGSATLPRQPLASLSTNIAKRKPEPRFPHPPEVTPQKRKSNINPDDLIDTLGNLKLELDESSETPARKHRRVTCFLNGESTSSAAVAESSSTTLKSIPDTRIFSPFESIPLELFDKITSHLSGRDLLRLRLTNKPIERLVRSLSTRTVTIEVLPSRSAAIHYTLRHTPELFSNVRELTLNTSATFLSNHGKIFKPLLEAHDCEILYYISEMHNLERLSFGSPNSSSNFQIHDGNYISYVRDLFDALFHSGIDCKGEEWYTRFLNISSLSVVLPLNKRYKHSITFLSLLTRLEEFEFNVYPNSYSAWDFGGSRMLIYLQEGFLSYLSGDRLRKLTIGFPSRTPGQLSLSVSGGFCNLKKLEITNYIITSRKHFFPDIIQLPCLTHLTCSIHIEVPWTGPSSTNVWSTFYNSLLHKTSLLSYTNTATLQGTGYAFRYNKVGYVDIASWEADPTANLRGDWDRVFRARRVGDVRKVVDVDRAAYVALQEKLKEKNRGQEEKVKNDGVKRYQVYFGCLGYRDLEWAKLEEVKEEVLG